MKTGRLPHLATIIAALIAVPLQSLKSEALADAPPTGKGPEVSTVGTDPYLGPLPEELAKLDQAPAPADTSPPVVKEPEAETISQGPGNILTPEELAKLAALLANPQGVTTPDVVTPVPEVSAETDAPELAPKSDR